MEVKAIHKTARIAPRKARLVIDLIRGKDIKEAQAILNYIDSKDMVICLDINGKNYTSIEFAKLIDESFINYSNITN